MLVLKITDLVQCDIGDLFPGDVANDGISIYNLEEAAENLVIGDDPEQLCTYLPPKLRKKILEAGVKCN